MYNQYVVISYHGNMQDIQESSCVVGLPF